MFPQLHISHDPVHRRRRGVVALLLVLLLTAGAGIGSWWWMAGRFTTVPAMSTMNEAKARDAARANALEINTTSAYSETVPKGIVIATDPASGERLLRGSPVQLTISLGPERYPVPPVVGLQRAEAEKALTDGKLTVGKVAEAFDETKPQGEVLAASHKEGEQLKPGTPIDLTVSKGRAPIRIPDLVNTRADSAKKELEALGFTVTMKEDHSGLVEAGRVLHQDPREGTGHRGDTIQLTKSLGPVMVTIPRVRGDDKDAAIKKLEDLDLKVNALRNTDFPIPLNLAQGTEPGEGAQVAVGTTVVLYWA